MFCSVHKSLCFQGVKLKESKDGLQSNLCRFSRLSFLFNACASKQKIEDDFVLESAFMISPQASNGYQSAETILDLNSLNGILLPSQVGLLSLIYLIVYN
jgi:hypothetical protein